jgi:hypothetical protein
MPGDRKGQAVWKRSLKTKDAREGKKLAVRTLLECNSDFVAAERAMQGKPAAIAPSLLLMPNTKDMEAEFYRAALKVDDEFRAEGDARRIHQTPEAFASNFNPRRALALRYVKSSALSPAASPVQQGKPSGARTEVSLMGRFAFPMTAVSAKSTSW